jgi:hypothetical protein
MWKLVHSQMQAENGMTEPTHRHPKLSLPISDLANQLWNHIL